MDGRFAVVDERFKDLLELIKSEGETTRRYLDDTLNQRLTSVSGEMRRVDETLNQRITSEHEATRRHFDVVAEKR